MSAIRQQYAKNLVSLRAMLARARAVAPRKSRGYTVEKLAESVARFEAILAMDDEALTAHLSRLFAPKA